MTTETPREPGESRDVSITVYLKPFTVEIVFAEPVLCRPGERLWIPISAFETGGRAAAHIEAADAGEATTDGQ